MSNMGTKSAADINNLQLADEGFDPTANQYAAPRPPTPGIYLASLDFREEDPEKRFRIMPYNSEKYPAKAGTAYLKTELLGTITEVGNEFEGRKVRDRFMSTGIFNKPTSGVASLLLTLGETLQGNEGHQELANMLSNILAGEPTVRIRTDWEWQGSKEGGYQTIKGYKNFPEVNGTVNHIVEDETTGEKFAAYGIITGYLIN